MTGKLLALAGPIRARVAASVVLGLAMTACYVLQGIFLALALAPIFAGPDRSGGWQAALPWIGAFAATVAVRAVLIWSSEIAAQATARDTKAYLRGRLLTRLLDLGPGYAARRQTGDLQATVVNGVEALETYYSRYLPAIFVALFGCLGVVLCLAWVDWRSALLLAAFVAALPLADRLWLRWRMPKSSGIFVALGAFAAYLLDSLQGIVTLKAFDAAARRRAALSRHAATLRAESMNTLAVTLMRTGLTGLIALGGVAAVLALNVWRVGAGDLAPVALLMTLFLAREAFRPLERFEREFHTAWAAGGAAAPITALLAEPPILQTPPAPATVRARPETPDIRFGNVTFAYDQDAPPALAGVSLAVGAGERVAVVGPSGAGKSTVVALLLRFFDPQAGAIRIGGVDIRTMELETLRSLMSVVSQETWLFHGTIEANLRLAKPEATRDEIEAAAKAAHIHDFIAGLPQGYDTPVGERGAQLSGGQRQRIAIARALLKDAPILLLDEATSSVDAANERAIQETLDALATRRTTLVIAHRLSTIRNADRVVVLDGGRIAEEGSPAALAARHGLFAKLMLMQGEAA